MGFFGRERSRAAARSEALSGGPSSLRFFDALVLSGTSEYSDSLSSCGRFLRLNEGRVEGTGDSRALTRGFSSGTSESRSRSFLSAESFAFFRMAAAAPATAEVDRDGTCGGAMGGRGFAGPDGAGSSRLRPSTGPFFFGGGGRGEFDRESIAGGVSDGLDLKPDPGSRRAGGRVALVGVPTELSSPSSRSRSRVFPFLLSFFDGIATSTGLLFVSAFAFLVPIDITAFLSARLLEPAFFDEPAADADSSPVGRGNA